MPYKRSDLLAMSDFIVPAQPPRLPWPLENPFITKTRKDMESLTSVSAYKRSWLFEVVMIAVNISLFTCHWDVWWPVTRHPMCRTSNTAKNPFWINTISVLMTLSLPTGIHTIYAKRIYNFKDEIVKILVRVLQPFLFHEIACEIPNRIECSYLTHVLVSLR